ncbi:hypothetical protein OS493_030626 [Desmophyllum pertusum]|uniref:VWFA domain-containing protein n=1 Tax=Desmophyllum pertusum TaxID=174260 RepID=A0A9X0D1D3_9CNID|nr:hypothetical protein OS493_030626 [Desmophyllum pertusum]
MKLFSIEPTFDLRKHLKVAFANSRQRESLKNACLQKEDKVRNSNLRMLSKYEIQAANLDGHLLSMIHQYGREDNIGVTLAINNTLQPEDPPTELMRAVNKNISYFVMAIIQAGLRKEVHDSDSNNMEVDAGPAEEPSSNGIVNVPSNLLASHEAPVERAVKAKEGIPKDNHELHRLANDVSALWRALGRELMVEEPRLDQIDTDFQQSSYEKAFQMLRNSGIAEALVEVSGGLQCIVQCEDDWAKEIKKVRKHLKIRQAEAKDLREKYKERYPWKDQCEELVEKMQNMCSDLVQDTQENALNKEGSPYPGQKRLKVSPSDPDKGNGRDTESGLTSKVTPTPTPPPKCNQALDIAVVIDGSESVKEPNFKVCLQFVANLTNRFNVSEQGTHFGGLVYSTNVYPQFTFKDFQYYNAKNLTEKFLSFPYVREGTRTDKALIAANMDLFSEKGGDRADKPDVLIVITDGLTHPTESTPYPTVLKPFKASIVTLGK